MNNVIPRNVFLEEALTGFSNVRVLLSTFSRSYGAQFSREKRKVGERCAGPNATFLSQTPSKLLAPETCKV